MARLSMKKSMFPVPDTTPLHQESRILSSIAKIDSTGWELELADMDVLDKRGGELQTLFDQTATPNIFFDPAFLSASHPRLDGTDKRMLLVNEIEGDARAIRMAMPVEHAQVGVPRRPAMRVWSHPYGPLSSPLGEGTMSAERLADLLFLGEFQSVQAIVFQDLPAQHPMIADIQKHEMLAQSVAVLNENERAALFPAEADDLLHRIFSRKQRQNFTRQSRRLADYGDVEYEITSDFMTAILRFEEFLYLEAKGWKGRRGTSMHSIKRTASFARQAVANMLQQGKCEVHSLRVKGKSVASLIVFHAHGCYFPWKIAFNEAYGPLSVGKQLMVHATRHMLLQPDFKMADSLAAPTNVLMNKLWPDRLLLCDMVIGVGHNPKANAATVVKSLKREKRMRVMVKNWLNHLTG